MDLWSYCSAWYLVAFLAVAGLVGGLVLPLVFLRLYTWYLEWVLGKRSGIRFRVHQVGLFSLNQLKLLLPSGSVLEIEHLWVSSSLFNRRYHSLLTICISDLRFQGDILELFRLSPSKSSKSATPGSGFNKDRLISLVKMLRVSLHLCNVSAMQFETPREQCLFHTTLQQMELYLRPAVAEGTRELDEVVALLSAFTVKIFKPSHLPQHSCLAQFSVSSSCSLSLDSQHPQVLSDIKISFAQPEILLYDELPFSSSLILQSSVKETVVPADSSLSSEITPSGGLSSVIPFLESLPRTFVLELQEVSAKYVQEGGRKTLSTNLNAFNLTFLNQKPADTELSVGLQGLLVSCGHNPLLSLVQLSITTKLTEEALDLDFKLSSFHASQTMEDLVFWTTLLPKNKSAQPAKEGPTMSQKYLPLLDGRSIRCNLEFKDTRIDLKIVEVSSLALVCHHGKLTTSSLLAPPGYHEVHDLNMELLLENMWCLVGEQASTREACLNIKRNHYWSMPLYVGVVLVQLKQYSRTDFRVESMIDHFQFEWSPSLAVILKKIKPPAAQGSPQKSVKSSTSPSFKFQLNLSNVNLFFLAEKLNCIMIRVDSLSFDTHKSTFAFEGLKLAQIVMGTNNKFVPCIKSSEIKLYDVFMNVLKISLNQETKEYTVQILDEIQATWSTNLHMTIYTLLEDLPFKLPSSKAQSKKSENSLKFQLHLEGPITLKAHLTKQYTLFVQLSDLNVHKLSRSVSIKMEQMEVGFNEHSIFEFQQVKIASSQESEDMLHRRSFQELETKHNKVWNLASDEVKIIFPFQFNFAEAFTENTVAVFKWLKILHKSTKSYSLPPDLVIKIKMLAFQLPDDPFEVKLRDNYVLLKDEYHESLERKRMLDEKVENLRKTHLLLPTGKLEELYSSLAKKNADIYVQRSRQLYDYSPMRTCLSLWTLEQFELIILADSSFHGTEKIVKTIKEIDADSPYPEEGLEFTTLWCRMIRGSIASMVCQLRNFPQPYLEVRELHIWGRLCGAEQAPTQRSKRLSVVEIPEPWGNVLVERNMSFLKFFHDLSCDMQSMCAAYGPCWEPVMSQVALSFEMVSRPSLDPSPTLTWWDKIRLLFHGRLTLSIQHLIFFLHASLDPYNTTEEMEINWSDVIIDWTNGKILKKGDLDIYVHTASKYDDCRLLHMPNLKLSVKLDWLCLGNPNDHHSITPCAPDKIPEYSINQTHDTYRAFRSQNLSLTLSLEIKIPPLEAAEDIPTLLLYSSTFKWFENLQMILSGVTRLTRKGKLFNNTKARKPQLSRHYRNIRLSLNFHKSMICYWTSFAKHKGLELLGGRLSLSMEHSLTLVPHNDNLIHRPRPMWNVVYMNCDHGDSEMWLFNCALGNNGGGVEPNLEKCSLNRTYFFSVDRVSYGREANVKYPLADSEQEDTPTHRLVIHGLKGAWTESNRDVIFSLTDSYLKGKQLKRNLATDALKGFKVENTNFKPPRPHTTSQSSSTQITSPCASSQAEDLLQKLVAEAENSPAMVYSEEMENTVGEQPLHGVSATQTNDVLHKNWLIELVNSQVMLKGSETSGYVIVSASKTQILQRIHQPTWKDRTLYSKTTWVGSLECMQYYATVDVGEPGPQVDSIMWLSLDNIEERETMVIADIPDMVGSGHSVGGIVSSTVGGTSDPSSAPLQLQRIVFRCCCQFYYVSYGQNLDQHNILDYVPPLPEDNKIWDEEMCVDAFTLTHHDLDICTNSMQYAMILDIVNNLLLYVEPRKKEARERLQRMRFQLQLCSIEDQRKPILQLQNQVRSHIFNLKSYEKEAYQIRLMAEKSNDDELVSRLLQLEYDINKFKEQLNNSNDELTMMISCYKETQMHVTKARLRSQEQNITTERHNQVCFKHARWRLTDKDGQLGIADLVLNNFIYSKVTKSNDSVEHLLELGYIMVNNLLPNQMYTEVLYPTEPRPNIPLDRQRALRIFCRENAPVGGISVKEHLEVNVVPITLSLTKAFYTEMMKFFFPGRDTDNKIMEEPHCEDMESYGTLRSRKRNQNQRGATSTLQKNDIEKMKERAKKNQTFLYIKIPEVPIRLSYKGDKNIKDLPNFNLVLPTLEYHNRTWTWLDLFMELKGVSKRVLLPQAIKQKILNTNPTNPNDRYPKEEEDKALLLLGSKLLEGPEKSHKRNFFGRLKR